ncbi:MAG: hypothetical protein M9908_12670 [Phyllobacteriaceae bacterium]|nr:hypothetical protein [Phyllobacteriaceae bacterium]
MRLLASFFLALLISLPGHAADKSQCNAKYDPGESIDMGPESALLWVSLAAAKFEYCGFEHLDFQPLFDKLLNKVQCGPETFLGRQLGKGNERIYESLKKMAAEQWQEFVLETFGDESRSEACKGVAEEHEKLSQCIVNDENC